MGQTSSPVIILGAGLAGLACALTLQKSGQPFLLIDKADQVGGRIKTTQTTEGFLLDHGFQVLLTSYQELKYFIDLKALDLQPFNSGALIYTPEKIRLLANPFLHPSQLINETFSDLFSLKDKALVMKLVLNLHTHAFDSLHGLSTFSFLQNFGFSERFIELFWRPFCAGVFLDQKLEVDSEFFIFLMKNFSLGRVALPKKGMQQIPLQMSAKIDQACLRLGETINEISKNEVVLGSGERLKARAVVCAFNNVDAAVNQSDSPPFRSVINYYFSTQDKLTWEKWLVLVPPSYGFNINNIAVMSQVAETYSTNGQQLLSVSVIGGADPGEDIVAKELKQIAGFDLNLKFIKKFNVKNALPFKYNSEETETQNGVYFCGDYLSSPSINGALKSGRRTAEKLIALSEQV